MNTWHDLGYRHKGLVSDTGEIIAEVRGTHPFGTYEYNGKRFVDCDSAKRAAEADHGQEAGR